MIQMNALVRTAAICTAFAGTTAARADSQPQPVDSLPTATDTVEAAQPQMSWLALDESLTTLTPTLHMGGAGYFCKLELPMGISSQLKTVGLALYPLDYGNFFPEVGLFPYLSAGGSANLALVRKQADGASGGGALFQGRAALGLKYRPVKMLSISVEGAYSPWELGSIAKDGLGGVPSARGGRGHGWDFSFGIEVL
jgi:hypothetical protein